MFTFVLCSTLCSNFLLVLLSIISKPSNKIVLNAKLSNFGPDDIKKISMSNICKTLFWNFMNIILASACFYVSFGYCAIWKQHASTILVLWTLTFVFDFILMEIILEIIIMCFYICRKVKVLRMIMKFFVTTKTLRNYH
jgi:hypothetical protein